MDFEVNFLRTVLFNQAKYWLLTVLVVLLALSWLCFGGYAPTAHGAVGVTIAAAPANNNLPLVSEYYTEKDHGAVVLMYHHIVPDAEINSGSNRGNNAVISLSQFEAEMAYLADNGYHTFLMSEVAAILHSGLNFPEKTVIITFDDGYESNYTLAYPLLQKYGIKATIAAVVVSSEQAENGMAVNSSLPHLTFAQMREMEASGLVEIGSHSYNGHGLVPVSKTGEQGKFFMARAYRADLGRQENQSEYIERIAQDLRLSKQVLESELGHTITYFAYPYGANSNNVVAALQQNNFLVAVTTAAGDIDKNAEPLTLNRRNVNQGISVAQFSALLQVK